MLKLWSIPASLLVILVALAGSVACGSSNEQLNSPTIATEGSASSRLGSGQTPTPTVGTALGAGEGASSPAFWIAESLESLVSHFPHVVVARVDALEEVVQEEIVIQGDVYPQMPTSVFSLSISETILSPGDKASGRILLGQAGGPMKDGTMRVAAPLPEIGKTYLFFFQDLSAFGNREQYYAGASFARFIVDGENRLVPNGYEFVKGIEAVSGVSAEDVLKVPEGEGRDVVLSSLASRSVGEAAAVIRDAATRVTPVPAQTAQARPTPTPTAAPVTTSQSTTGSPSPSLSPATP